VEVGGCDGTLRPPVDDPEPVDEAELVGVPDPAAGREGVDDLVPDPTPAVGVGSAGATFADAGASPSVEPVSFEVAWAWSMSCGSANSAENAPASTTAPVANLRDADESRVRP
jgi:hypothetical protein